MNRLLPFLLLMLWVFPAFAWEAFFKTELAKARNGDAEAQAILGFMYDSGEWGIPENDLKAYIWWSLAKAQGHKAATSNLDRLKNEMTKEQIAKGQALATKCWESEFQDCD